MTLRTILGMERTSPGSSEPRETMVSALRGVNRIASIMGLKLGALGNGLRRSTSSPLSIL